MKIETYKYPKSSFLSMEKDMSIIVDMIMKNENLKKLLYYTTKDCYNKPDLTEEQTLELFENNIKMVPKLYIDNEVFNYLLINFDNFIPNETNPEFRNNMVHFDIVCHFDQWQLRDFELRPYKIAAEIDSMFNDKHLTGIGTLQFVGAVQVKYTDEFAGFCLMYEAIHGEEDKKFMPNPANEDRFLDNFNNIYNNG